jgi:hypothetical protein
MCRESN